MGGFHFDVAGGAVARDVRAVVRGIRSVLKGVIECASTGAVGAAEGVSVCLLA